MEKKKDFLINLAYWAVIAGAVYLAFEYLVPVFVPVLLGLGVAWLVVSLTRKLRCTHKLVRLGLALVFYGVLGLLVVLLAARGAALVGVLVKWIPQIYEKKFEPLLTLVYQWIIGTVEMLNPTMLSALEMVLESVISALKNMMSNLSSGAVSLVSGIAKGVPNLVFSLLAMIFSTIFVVADYDNIASFTAAYTPEWVKKILNNVRIYLTDTLLVVIRSYVLIMILTFTELSILFSVFGIEKAVLKAGLIAVMDIMPILGTGGVMIPWAVISLVLGYTGLGLKLLLIYAIVTVVRNYVEPKIVGAQLGLHPIITLVAMFVGLRLFGFWGLFGLPVGISFLWKQRKQ